MVGITPDPLDIRVKAGVEKIDHSAPEKTVPLHWRSSVSWSSNMDREINIYKNVQTLKWQWNKQRQRMRHIMPFLFGHSF